MSHESQIAKVTLYGGGSQKTEYRVTITKMDDILIFDPAENPNIGGTLHQFLLDYNYATYIQIRDVERDEIEEWEMAAWYH